MRSSDQRSGHSSPIWTCGLKSSAAIHGVRSGSSRIWRPRGCARTSPPSYAILIGRLSIPPEMLVQAFYSIRSERRMAEGLEFGLLFRWFVGLSVDAPACDHSSFDRNRDRLLAVGIAAKFLAAVLVHRRV